MKIQIVAPKVEVLSITGGIATQAAVKLDTRGACPATSEHTVVSFRIVCDRVTATHLTRHRLISWTQESQVRAADKEELLLIENPELGWKAGDVYDLDHAIPNIPLGLMQVRNAWDTYRELVQKSLSREAARRILPEAIATILIGTGNLRAWSLLVETRRDHSDYQTRFVAGEIGRCLSSM
jgi:thymidylate synthase ThyX